MKHQCRPPRPFARRLRCHPLGLLHDRRIRHRGVHARPIFRKHAAFAVQDALNAFVGVLLVLAVITCVIIADRGPSYLIIALATLGIVALHFETFLLAPFWTLQLSITIMAVLILETVVQLKSMSRGHIRRLESIATFSRHISSTLDTRQVMALLSAAFQNAVEADTYFVGLRDGDGGSHLITFKPDPAPYSSSFIHGESWLDYDSMQTWKSVELIYPMVTRDYNMQPVKPVLMADTKLVQRAERCSRRSAFKFYFFYLTT